MDGAERMKEILGAAVRSDRCRDLAQQAVCREGIRVILRAKNVLLPSV